MGHGKAVDWWSCGVLLYEMLTGSPPFFCRNRQQMYRNVIRGRLTFPSIISADARDFLSHILIRRPEDRLGAGGVGEIRGHPLFADIDWAKLSVRGIPPPFKPRLKENDMTVNFDPQFTSEPPRDTYIPPDSVASTVQGRFKQFNYNKDAHGDRGAD